MSRHIGLPALIGLLFSAEVKQSCWPATVNETAPFLGHYLVVFLSFFFPSVNGEIDLVGVHVPKCCDRKSC